MHSTMPYWRDVDEQHFIPLQPFEMPSTNGDITLPSPMDGGGLGLSFKPLCNPVRGKLAVQ